MIHATLNDVPMYFPANWTYEQIITKCKLNAAIWCAPVLIMNGDDLRAVVRPTGRVQEYT